MSFVFVAENDASRAELTTFLGRLTDDDLRRVNVDGWTIAALLVHLAFWDQRMVVLLRRWQAEGMSEAPVDPDMINDSLKPLALALDPQAAVQLCLSAAQETDAALAAASEALVAAIQSSDNHFRFNRALHRRDHIGEIERLLEANN